MQKLTKSYPLVSVLILTYNRTDLLKQCLNSVLKSDYPNLEFIISDNASTDDIEGFIKKNYPRLKIKVFRKKKNGGLTGGFNFGFKFCKGKYVMLLSNDTTITKESISSMVKMAENDSKIGAIAPKVTQMKNPGFIHSAGSFLTNTGILYHYGVYQKDGKKYQKSYYVFSTTGAGFLVRSKTIAKTGLYSEDFFMAYDESDLCHRVWLGGYTIVYCPKAEVKHLWAATQDPGKPVVWFWNQRNILSSFIINFSAVSLLWFLILINISWWFIFCDRIIRRKFKLALTLPRAYWWHLTHIKETLERRRYVQKKIRKVSDQEIFQKTLLSPNWKYYLLYFKRKFNDIKLPARVLYKD